jgi:peptidoglycan/xylan/chitin deacetylase (PgdA/CDA1 family)
MLEVETSSEILALVGTLGAGGAHLHMTLGDADGAVVGGHLVAAEVHTTAEIVLVALDDLTFARPMDSSTGFKELAVVANANAVSAAAPAGAPARALSATAGAVEDTSLVHPARDLIGYGGAPPQPRWPGGALLALNFVLNLEEGSEASFEEGDGVSEASLCECSSDAPGGVRDLAAEGMFEYGSRAGFWRVLREFEKRAMPATVMACAVALERNAPQAEAVRRGMESGLLDVCCHGYRWEDHIAMPEARERAQIAKAVASLTRTLGERPTGWYCRTAPSLNTRRLLVEEGGFLYDSDAYNDDLPYYSRVAAAAAAAAAAPAAGDDAARAPSTTSFLVVPYTLANNDSKFAPGRAFGTSDDFFCWMRDAFDVLLAEGEDGSPKMMSVGLHMRLIGHPARLRGLQRFLDYVDAHPQRDSVWVAPRGAIAKHWRDVHPPEEF